MKNTFEKIHPIVGMITAGNAIRHENILKHKSKSLMLMWGGILMVAKEDLLNLLCGAPFYNTKKMKVWGIAFASEVYIFKRDKSGTSLFVFQGNKPSYITAFIKALDKKWKKDILKAKKKYGIL